MASRIRQAPTCAAAARSAMISAWAVGSARSSRSLWPAADHLAADGDHRADRHVVVLERPPRLLDRGPHEALVGRLPPPIAGFHALSVADASSKLGGCRETSACRQCSTGAQRPREATAPHDPTHAPLRRLRDGPARPAGGGGRARPRRGRRPVRGRGRRAGPHGGRADRGRGERPRGDRGAGRRAARPERDAERDRPRPRSCPTIPAAGTSPPAGRRCSGTSPGRSASTRPPRGTTSPRPATPAAPTSSSPCSTPAWPTRPRPLPALPRPRPGQVPARQGLRRPRPLPERPQRPRDPCRVDDRREHGQRDRRHRPGLRRADPARARARPQRGGRLGLDRQRHPLGGQARRRRDQPLLRVRQDRARAADPEHPRRPALRHSPRGARGRCGRQRGRRRGRLPRPRARRPLRRRDHRARLRGRVLQHRRAARHLRPGRRAGRRLHRRSELPPARQAGARHLPDDVHAQRAHVRAAGQVHGHLDGRPARDRHGRARDRLGRARPGSDPGPGRAAACSAPHATSAFPGPTTATARGSSTPRPPPPPPPPAQ